MNFVNTKTASYGPYLVTIFQIGNDRTNLKARIFNATQDNIAIVPIEICAIAAGKDAWMKDILFACPDCGKPTKARDSEARCICPECYEKAAAEFED